MIDSVQFFVEYKHVFIITHVFSVIVGMGGAIIADILFNSYISDKKINPTENKTLQILSKIIWISLASIILNGLFLFLSDPIRYSESVKFITKIIIVGTLTINGLLFWKVTHTSLKKFNLNDTNFHHKYVRMRKLSFAFGSISIVSWISAFILGSVKSIPISLSQSVSIYVTVLLIAILCSQVLEYLITRKK